MTVSPKVVVVAPGAGHPKIPGGALEYGRIFRRFNFPLVTWRGRWGGCTSWVLVALSTCLRFCNGYYGGQIMLIFVARCQFVSMWSSSVVCSTVVMQFFYTCRCLGDCFQVSSIVFATCVLGSFRISSIGVFRINSGSWVQLVPCVAAGFR